MGESTFHRNGVEPFGGIVGSTMALTLYWRRTSSTITDGAIKIPMPDSPKAFIENAVIEFAYDARLHLALAKPAHEPSPDACCDK